MLGDLVQGFSDNTFAEILEISHCGRVTISTQDGQTITLNPKDILPIPLTEEILKKNGWEQDTPGVLWHKDLDFCIDYWKETFWCSAMNGLHLDYVHKLQQLIRLSGFTEIANNFKL